MLSLKLEGEKKQTNIGDQIQETREKVLVDKNIKNNDPGHGEKKGMEMASLSGARRVCLFNLGSKVYLVALLISFHV